MKLIEFYSGRNVSLNEILNGILYGFWEQNIFLCKPCIMLCMAVQTVVVVVMSSSIKIK